MSASSLNQMAHMSRTHNVTRHSNHHGHPHHLHHGDRNRFGTDPTLEKGNEARMIRLRRLPDVPLGFSIRGGWEHGTGIYVSEVHHGSEADRQGLMAGDQIITVNGVDIEGASHEDVISLVRSQQKILLKVRSVGLIPVRETTAELIAWKKVSSSSIKSPSSLNSSDHQMKIIKKVDPSGITTCPVHRLTTFHPTVTAVPSSSKGSTNTSSSSPKGGGGGKANSSSCFSSAGSSATDSDSEFPSSISNGTTSSSSSIVSDVEIIEEKMYITMKLGQGLGCSVVRGPEVYPGIFVQEVKAKGVAETAGLQVGDQIIGMNGFSFYPGHYEFNDAISKIKACKQMTLTVRKRVGINLFKELSMGTVTSINSILPSGQHKVRTVLYHPIIEHPSLEVDADQSTPKNSSGSKVRRCRIHGSKGQLNTSLSSSSNVSSASQSDLLHKMRQEEERLAGERRQLERDQHRLQVEMRRLAHDREQLENMKIQQQSKATSDGDSAFSSASSISSASSATSTASSPPPVPDNNLTTNSSQPDATDKVGHPKTQMGFLDELKQLAERRNNSDGLLMDTLKKTQPNNGDGDGDSSSHGSKVVHKLNPDDEKRKQHEMLMMEFRNAHSKMFGRGAKGLAPPPMKDTLPNTKHDSPKHEPVLMNKQVKVEAIVHQTEVIPASVTTMSPKKKMAPPPPPPPPPPSVYASPSGSVIKPQPIISASVQPLVTISSYASSQATHGPSHGGISASSSSSSASNCKKEVTPPPPHFTKKKLPVRINLIKSGDKL